MLHLQSWDDVHHGHVAASEHTASVSMGPHYIGTHVTSPDSMDGENTPAATVVKAAKEIKKLMALGEKFVPDHKAELDAKNHEQMQMSQSKGVAKALDDSDFMTLAKEEAEANNKINVTPDMVQLENKIRSAMRNSPAELHSFAEISEQLKEKTPIPTCTIDYNLPCPQGWKLKTVAEKKLCVGENYTGECNKELDLTGFSRDQKAAVARVCSAPFPCQGPCPQDFSQQCPLGWNEDGPTSCKADPNYSGPCSKDVNTSMWSDEEKFAFGVQCGVTWRCKASAGDGRLLADCHRDYEPNCPIKWVEIRPGICVAPPDYQGTCRREINVAHWGTQAKRNFAESCGTKWPCASSSELYPGHVSTNVGRFPVNGLPQSATFL